MAHDKLLEYLKIMIDMEMHLYAQNMICTQLAQCADQLAVRIPHTKPTPPAVQRRYTTIWAFFLLVVLSFGIFFGFLFFISSDYPRANFQKDSTLLIVYYIALPLLLICALAIISKIIGSIISTIEYNRVVNDLWQTYQEQLDDYEMSLQYEKIRLESEQLKKDYYVQELAAMERIRTDTLSSIERFYQLDLIYPKYHSLTMLSCLYESFASGLCTELSGLNGAYRFLETELQFGRIPATLEEAASFPAELKERLYVLYHTLDMAHDQAECLLHAIDSHAKENPEVGICKASAEYKNAREKAKEEYENRIKYISLWRIKK